MKRIVSIALASGLMFASGLAWAADVAGSKDPAFLKRYEGSEIVKYTQKSYDRYLLASVDPTSKFGWKFDEIEGQITRVFYHEPAGHSVLEMIRNYQQALTDAGFTQITEFSHDIRDPFDFGKSFYGQGVAQVDDPFHYTTVKTSGYIAAKGTKDGQDITVAIYFAEYGHPEKFTLLGNPKPVTFQPSELAVVVDVVTAKAVENKMVVVKSDEMAKALKDTGKIDIYGITFDIDKTDIKPESTATLDEVAKLLKSDPALKLEVAGHTDNTGDKAHNQTLSEGRAASVVAVLTKTYGVDPARLQAKGYGDTKPVAPNDSEGGRAKNRRVELRKL